MIGRVFNKAKVGFSSGVAAVQPTMNYDITSHTKVESTEQLPKVPASAFRKRPVKLSYDKNEYYTFRMPSEKDFLLGGFDS
jgi:hypothetical protein